MTMKRFVLILGAAIVAIGIAAGTFPLHATAAGASSYCGNGFAKKPNEIRQDHSRTIYQNEALVDACYEKARTWEFVGYAVAGLGAAVLIGGAFIKSHE
ncbi:hypothetical protein MNVM_21340 [Mycobacterium novum]|uniref:Uncharacterized protein n=2 Tax=Mycobacterium novum TaxID=2492438 RepID=A0A7I7JMQ2_9MYCO|nr:hypothetical protein MNVM_21340 [Mycobacterium novum]